nr:eukaryotic translation initiation factor 3 subunit A-like isoform X2 [Danaus plexippus plexippus]
MSQIVTRKGPVGEDKDKRQTDSPVKDMKKKLAANAEKEKQAAEKNAEKSQAEKKIDKGAEKTQSDKKGEKVSDKQPNEKKTDRAAEKQGEKKAEKIEKSAEKPDKKEKADKNTDKKDKTEKSADKKDLEKKETEKVQEKKEKASDKKDVALTEKAKEDSTAKEAGKPEAECSKPKSKEPSNVPNVASVANATHSANVTNGANITNAANVSNVANVAGVSNGVNGDATNGDTVSSEDEDDRDDMFPELAYDDSDGDFEPPTPEGRSYTRRSQSKVLKLKEDTPLSDRKLRSSGSPKPDKKKESPRKNDTNVILEEAGDGTKPGELHVDNEERVKVDTNYSRSRVKVSPYRRLHEDSSLLAEYTGNNSTMEMDITESSWSEASYFSGLRTIRGRRSYKTYKDSHARTHSSLADTASPGLSSEAPVRPTGTVVGRKRRPEGEGPGVEADSSKRARLVDRLTRPFRMATTAIPVRSHSEIVGINTDLPLSAPVSSESFDPEALKCEAPAPRPGLQAAHADKDGRRCVIV